MLAVTLDNLSWKCHWYNVNVLATDQNVANFWWHSIFCSVIFWRFLACKVYQMISQRKNGKNFYFTFEFFGTYGVHDTKNWNHAWKYFLALKFGIFVSFFNMSWHVVHQCQCQEALKHCNIQQLQLSWQLISIFCYCIDVCFFCCQQVVKWILRTLHFYLSIEQTIFHLWNHKVLDSPLSNDFGIFKID